MKPHLLGATCGLLALAALGCGGPEEKTVPLVRGRGVVTMDGIPLENAVVVFESPEGSFSYASTDSAGRYDLSFDSQRLGVTIGEKVVRIAMNRRLKGLNANDEGTPDDKAGGAFPKQPPETIPQRYNAKSILTVHVTRNSRTFDFELSSDKESPLSERGTLTRSASEGNSR